MVKRNLPAYHHAAKCIHKPVEDLIKQFENVPVDLFRSIEPIFDGPITVIPLLANPATITSIADDFVFVGLYFHKFYELIERPPTRKYDACLKSDR